MSTQLTVELKDLRFRAYHGLYEEERLTGNEFIVDLSVTARPHAALITVPGETIDYVSLHAIVKRRMLEPQDLLETVAGQILDDIHEHFPAVKTASIRIAKTHPPIPQFRGAVAITLHRDY